VTRTADELTLGARVEDARSEYRFRTADGVHSAASFRDAELLVLDALWGEISRSDRLLCPQANYGVVGTVLGDAADAVLMTESSARSAGLCERNAARNGVDAEVSLVDRLDADRAFDLAAYAPKPYVPIDVGKRRLGDALASLRPGGNIAVAAATHTGLSRYESFLAEVAGGVERVLERDGWTVLRAERPATVDPPNPVERRRLRPTVDAVDLELVSEPGLFAASSLDDDTRQLLESTDVDAGERVLDLCCGYGPVGVYAALTADCEVWLTDDDRRATACAERSLAASGVSGEVLAADCVEGVAGRTFDRVLCNPPTHAGAGVLDDLLVGAADVLGPDGVLRAVHHRALDLTEHLRAFETVRTVRTGPEHAVIEATL